MIYALLGCTKKKAGRPCAARDLYAASPGFRGLLRVAEAAGQAPLILSAEHGLLLPDQVLAPYDVTLIGKPKWERRWWSQLVLADLYQLLHRGDRCVSYLGETYGEFIVPALRQAGYPVLEPVKGKRPGELRAWCRDTLQAVS
jgi:hypothetical protein